MIQMFRTLTAIVGMSAALAFAVCAADHPTVTPMPETSLPSGVNPQQRYGWTPLHWAARHGQRAEVRRLLDGGAAVDARENLGRTPLHLAAMADHRDVVELLLARGADVNARDRWDVTPLRRLELLRQVRQWDRADLKNLLSDSGGVR